MRCKVGDLAVIVHSHVPANVGLLVEVVAPSPVLGWWQVRTVGGRIVARNHVLPSGNVVRPDTADSKGDAMDSQLRPIRDSDKEDETLTWREKETV